MLISHKGHTDTIQVYSVTVMTHVKALQAGHSNQGTSEPITPVWALNYIAEYIKITDRLNCEIQATHHTRQHNQIFIERCNSTVASKLPYYTFPILWNKWAKTLPASKCQVKSQMRSTILASYAESVKCSNDHCRDCKN